MSFVRDFEDVFLIFFEKFEVVGGMQDDDLCRNEAQS